MVYAKDIGSVEVHHVLDFLSAMFDTGVATINSAKLVVAITLHILTNPSINEHPLFIKQVY